MGWAAAAFAGLSTVGDMMSAHAEGQANAASARYNADTARQNALLSRRKGELDALNVRRSGAEILGAEQAAYANAGVTQSGSAADVRAASAAAIETDALTAKYNGELTAIGYDRAAGLGDMEAKNAKRAGNVGMATALLSGAGKVYAAAPKG